MAKGYTILSIKMETRDRLIRIAGKVQAETGKITSMSDAIDYLIDWALAADIPPNAADTSLPQKEEDHET